MVDRSRAPVSPQVFIDRFTTVISEVAPERLPPELKEQQHISSYF
ncbi:MAG: hypothetical protein AB1391_04045 [Candidatus Micrarchaeota archaeon]